MTFVAIVAFPEMTNDSSLSVGSVPVRAAFGTILLPGRVYECSQYIYTDAREP